MLRYMKYLQRIYSKNININSQRNRRLRDLIIGQPLPGKTVIACTSPDKTDNYVYYVGKQLKEYDDCPVKYTWRFEYYNGYPAIIVNFSKIDKNSINSKCVLCLESNNMARGNSGTFYTFRTDSGKIYKRENNNRALNVLYNCRLIEENRGITFYQIKDLSINTDYVLYITLANRFYQRALNLISKNHLNENIYNIKINIRPTIRGTFSENPNKPQLRDINSYTFRHNPYIPAKEYTKISCMLSECYKL